MPWCKAATCVQVFKVGGGSQKGRKWWPAQPEVNTEQLSEIGENRGTTLAADVCVSESKLLLEMKGNRCVCRPFLLLYPFPSIVRLTSHKANLVRPVVAEWQLTSKNIRHHRPPAVGTFLLPLNAFVDRHQSFGRLFSVKQTAIKDIRPLYFGFMNALTYYYYSKRDDVCCAIHNSSRAAR